MTRGQCGSLRLHCKGLPPSTPCRSPGAQWVRFERAVYTLIETAKLNGLDPEAYLREVIGRIAELLPWNIGLVSPIPVAA